MSVSTSVRGGLTRVAALLAVAAMLAVGSVAHAHQPAAAVEGSQFDPGMIITDDLFYDRNAMTAAEIQTFLDGKIGTCLSDRCLNVAVLPVSSRAASYSVDTGLLVCSAISGGNLRVSELIYRVQAACNISAKVILVTLQKEQGLVTSRAPSDWALRAAMGMGCPDTAPCDDAFAGLANQIISGARQLHVYKIGKFGRQPGTQYVQYHPNASCGGTNVNVRNYATAALYNYTPYQPNAAALANLGGTGDSCSSYGNRNFWKFYNDWFGPTWNVNANAQIDEFYASLSAADQGRLGAESTAARCAASAVACQREYANGIIAWTRAGGAQIVEAPILARYRASGGATGSLGGPTIPMTRIEGPHGDGFGQRFTNNAYIHASDHGVFVVQGAILDRHVATGWVRGDLGWPIADADCGSGVGCIQQFQFGRITVDASRTQADVMSGPLAAAFDAAGGTAKVGHPVTAVTSIESPYGNGSGQRFSRNAYFHVSGSGTFLVQGALLDAHVQEGWVRGSLGWPIDDASCNAAGAMCSQRFQYGMLSSMTTGGVTKLPAAFSAAVHAAGGTSVIGFPTIPVTAIDSPHGAGSGQRYANNAYVHSSARGTYLVQGRMLDAYVAEGWVRGNLGWPTATASCTGGTCTQHFQYGTITVPPSGAHVVTFALPAPMQAVLDAAGGTGVLGNPVTAVTDITGPHGNGQGIRFANNAYIHSSGSGAFLVQGRMLDAYVDAGWVRGPLGWPTAAETCSAGTCTQEFQHGSIVLPAAGHARVVPSISDSSIRNAYTAAGGVSALGEPTTATTPILGPNGDGTGQRFANNAYIHSSASGAFVVQGAMLDAYIAAGWVRGTLGWPTAAAVCSSGTCSQQFQFGTIILPPSGAARIVPAVTDAAIRAAYDAAGGVAVLGDPVIATTQITGPNGDGTGQRFANNAYIHSSASGTFVVQGPMLDAYIAAGWVRGSLGWPTAAASCSATTCTQKFQFGTLSAPR